MKRKMKLLVVVFSLLIFAISIQAKVIVIANKSVKQTSLPKIALKAMFLGDVISWKDGEELVLTLSKNMENTEGLLKTYIKKTPSKFKKHWKKVVFTGKGSMPEEFETDAEVIEFVKKTKGAVGYISAESLTDDVKALIIK